MRPRRARTRPVSRRLRHGIGGTGEQATGSALPGGSVEVLGQGEEPEASGDEPRTVACVSLPAASCSGLPTAARLAHPPAMGTKSRESMFGPSVRASAERAAAARKEADRLACEAWNTRMLGYRGPAQPSPTLGDALNAGYLYLEVRCLGCDTHQTVALDIVRRPKSTPIHGTGGDSCS